MESTHETYGISSDKSPNKMQNYPLINTKIDKLVGADSKRKYDYHVLMLNSEGIRLKEQGKKNEFIDEIMKFSFQNREGAVSEIDVAKKMESLRKYLDKGYNDIREKASNYVLEYLWNTQNIALTFSKGLQDALIAGEEIYRVDDNGGEPMLRRVNPINFYRLGGGESWEIEKADKFIEEGWYSMNEVLDMYYDELTENEVSTIEAYSRGETGKAKPTATEADYRRGEITVHVAESAADLSSGDFAFDARGNIRVLRCVWHSERKLGKLKYLDDAGDEQHKWVDESYVPDKEAGESVKWKWVSEWWEGTKIGKDVYTRMRPIPRIGPNIDNPSKCLPPYVGTIYSTNSNRALSFMEKLKPLQYLYNIIMYRTKIAIAKYNGPVMKMSMSKKPKGWSWEQWVGIMREANVLLEDEFNVGTQGASMGVLAGNFNTATGQILNPDMGPYIQNNIALLAFIRQEAGMESGLPEQRMGEINQEQTVGGIEHAIRQSSDVTEFWMLLHEDTKRRALNLLLEYAKYIWKDQYKTLSYITGDVEARVFDIDGSEFANHEYGIYSSTTGRGLELENLIKSLAHAAVQTGTASLSDIVSIWNSQSTKEMETKLLEAEQRKVVEAQQQQQAQMQQQAQLIAEQLNIEKEKAATDRMEVLGDQHLKSEDQRIKEEDNLRKADIQLAKEAGAKDVTPKTEAEIRKIDAEVEAQQRELDIKRRKAQEDERKNRRKEEIEREKTDTWEEQIDTFGRK